MLPIGDLSLGTVLIRSALPPQGSWESPVAKGDRPGLEDLTSGHALVQACSGRSRQLAQSPAPLPSLQPKPKRGARRVSLLSQLPLSVPHPEPGWPSSQGRGWKAPPRRGGGVGSGECDSLPPLATSPAPPRYPPPPPSEWFAPSALFNPGDCSSAGSLLVPTSAPGSQKLRGALSVRAVVYPLPSPGP